MLKPQDSITPKGWVSDHDDTTIRSGCVPKPFMEDLVFVEAAGSGAVVTVADPPSSLQSTLKDSLVATFEPEQRAELRRLAARRAVKAQRAAAAPASSRGRRPIDEAEEGMQPQGDEDEAGVQQATMASTPSVVKEICTFMAPHRRPPRRRPPPRRDPSSPQQRSSVSDKGAITVVSMADLSGEEDGDTQRPSSGIQRVKVFCEDVFDIFATAVNPPRRRWTRRSRQNGNGFEGASEDQESSRDDCDKQRQQSEELIIQLQPTSRVVRGFVASSGGDECAR